MPQLPENRTVVKNTDSPTAGGTSDRRTDPGADRSGAVAGSRSGNVHSGWTLSNGRGRTSDIRSVRPTAASAADVVDLATERRRRKTAAAAYRQRLLELHRIAEDLNRLHCDDRYARHRGALDAELHHRLADTVELLTEICDTLPLQHRARD